MIKVFAEGRVAVEGEVFEYGSRDDGTPRTGVRFGLICNKFYNDENPTFIMVTLYNRDETLAQYLTMGNQIIVEGDLSSRRDENGNTWYSLNAKELSFGAKKMGAEEPNNSYGTSNGRW